MIRNRIINRIIEIKKDEDNFKSSYWKNNFVSYDQCTEHITKHISEADFENMTDEDLTRIFEYIILVRNDISINRVNKQYFS